MINRRQFLSAAGAAGTVCMLSNPLLSQPPAVGARRPNFIFILTDDQRYDAMGFVQREQGDKARFPWFKTPNLDRIAAEGVHFKNAFVVNSLCAPSRATFLTGCYGYLNGIVNNHTEFPADNVTHASLLRHLPDLSPQERSRDKGRKSIAIDDEELLPAAHAIEIHDIGVLSVV